MHLLVYNRAPAFLPNAASVYFLPLGSPSDFSICRWISLCPDNWTSYLPTNAFVISLCCPYGQRGWPDEDITSGLDLEGPSVII